MKILVLLSQNYGAGWSTWADTGEVADFVLTYEPIIEHIKQKSQEKDPNRYYRRPTEWHGLNEKHPLVVQMIEEIKTRFNVDFYASGAADLDLYEFEVPTLFEMLDIVEHDGEERSSRVTEWELTDDGSATAEEK